MPGVPRLFESCIDSHDAALASAEWGSGTGRAVRPPRRGRHHARRRADRALRGVAGDSGVRDDPAARRRLRLRRRRGRGDDGAIRAAAAAGAHGVVFGALRRDATIDAGVMRRLIDVARPLPVTCHKAIDATRDPVEALEALLALGVDRVLTSGGARHRRGRRGDDRAHGRACRRCAGGDGRRRRPRAQRGGDRPADRRPRGARPHPAARDGVADADTAAWATIARIEPTPSPLAAGAAEISDGWPGGRCASAVYGAMRAAASRRRSRRDRRQGRRPQAGSSASMAPMMTAISSPAPIRPGWKCGHLEWRGRVAIRPSAPMRPAGAPGV